MVNFNWILGLRQTAFQKPGQFFLLFNLPFFFALSKFMTERTESLKKINTASFLIKENVSLITPPVPVSALWNWLNLQRTLTWLLTVHTWLSRSNYLYHPVPPSHRYCGVGMDTRSHSKVEYGMNNSRTIFWELKGFKNEWNIVLTTGKRNFYIF